MPSATDINQDAHLFIDIGQNGGHGTSVENFPFRRKFRNIKASHISKKQIKKIKPSYMNIV